MRIWQGATALLLLATRPAFAQAEPPLPPPRPADAPAATPAAAPHSEPPASPKPEMPATADASAACLSALKAAGFDLEAAETPKASNDACRIEAPVRLKAVPVPTRPETIVRFPEEPILACRFAAAFGHWVGDLVSPVMVGTKGTDLKAVRTGPGFECRNRNGAPTGKLSAHAEGLAIDIAGFELANGSTLRVKADGRASPDPALSAVRTGGCGWFTTILGPGSDPAHESHLHVDILQHGSSDRYRICQ